MNFDLIDPSTFTEKFFNFKVERFYAKKAMSERKNSILIDSFVDLNYETYNSIKNVDGLFILILGLLAFTLIVIVVKGVILLMKRKLNTEVLEGGETMTLREKCWKRVKSFVIRTYNGIYMNWTMSVFKESIFQILLAAALFLSMPSEVRDNVKRSNSFTYDCSLTFAILSLIIGMVIYPGVCLFIATRSHNELRS